MESSMENVYHHRMCALENNVYYTYFDRKREIINSNATKMKNIPQMI